MSTSSTQVKKKTTTAAADIIEARMVCMNDDGFQEIEYVKKDDSELPTKQELLARMYILYKGQGTFCVQMLQVVQMYSIYTVYTNNSRMRFTLTRS